jgi:hypothetical protein
MADASSGDGIGNPLQGFEELAVRQPIADDQQVDFASSVVGSPGHRAKHEGRPDGR